MVIVINPRQRTVRVHRSATEVRHLTIADTLDGEDVVPGWTMPVRALFAPAGEQAPPAAAGAEDPLRRP